MHCVYLHYVYLHYLYLHYLYLHSSVANQHQQEHQHYSLFVCLGIFWGFGIDDGGICVTEKIDLASTPEKQQQHLVIISFGTYRQLKIK